MTRSFTGQGHAYNQLLIGLLVLGLTVLGSAIWLGRILYSWSRKITSLEASLAGRRTFQTDFPALPLTGELELDRLVDALNATGVLLADQHRRATSAERLAAVGRLAAGLAHEIRNPIAAMRLKAENALAVLYEQGSGVQKDLTRAVYWYKLAAAQGMAEAQYHLGMLTETGHGITRDPAEAVNLYTRSATQGYVPAQERLGACYASGKGAAQNAP